MKYLAGKITLSARERMAFFARDWPELAGSGKPPPDLEGVSYALSSRLSFIVDKVHRTKKGWRLDYSVLDDREDRYFLLPSAANLEVDGETGQIAHLPAEEEIGYTKNPTRRRADPLPAVAPNVQKVFDMRSRLQAAQAVDEDVERAELRNRQQVRAINRALTEYVVWAARNGVSAAPVFAQMDKLIRGLEEEQEAA